MKPRKWECSWCEHRFTDGEELTGVSPFDGEPIAACPKCKLILGEAQYIELCDEPGCTEEACAGTPTDDGGYVRHCHRHPPQNPRKQ